MDWNQAVTLFRQIEAIGSTDSALEACQREFLDQAIRYARLRTDWLRADRHQRDQMDTERTRAHNAWIDACNILSRQMGNRGMNNAWREKLGMDRIEIGDFACYIHCIMGLKAR